MLNKEKLNAIIKDDFDYLAEIVEVTYKYGREDEDIEKIMKRHDLDPKDAADILEVMESARYNANAQAVKAADKGAAAAIAVLDEEKTGWKDLDNMYREIWEKIHDVTMNAEYKALARIA